MNLYKRYVVSEHYNFMEHLQTIIKELEAFKKDEHATEFTFDFVGAKLPVGSYDGIEHKLQLITDVLQNLDIMPAFDVNFKGIIYRTQFCVSKTIFKNTEMYYCIIHYMDNDFEFVH